MRKHLYILLAALFPVVACTEKLVIPDEPEITEYSAISSVSAVFEPLSLSYQDGTPVAREDNWSWKEADRIGVSGSIKGSNVRYFIRKEYAGTTGKAVFYGNEVAGEITAYYPYSTQGPVRKPYQQHFADPYEFFLGNTILESAVKDGEARFAYTGGLLELEVEYSQTPVSGLKFSSGNAEVEVRGIGYTPSGKSSMKLFILLPAGDYTNVSLNLDTPGKAVSKIFEAAFNISDSRITRLQLKEKENNYEIDDFSGKDSEFTDPIEY